MNQILLIGRLARDVELKHTKNGTPVASFRLAVDRDYKDKETGERGTDWIDCTAWRGTAELAAKYLGKGRLVAVQGRLQIRQYEDSQGIRRTGAEVVVGSIQFCDSRPRSTQEEPAYAPAAAGASLGGGYGAYAPAAGGDLPF